MSRVEGVVKTINDGVKGILGDLGEKSKKFIAEAETAVIKPKQFNAATAELQQNVSKGFGDDTVDKINIAAANTAIKDTYSSTQNDIRYAGLGESDPKQQAASQAVYATMNIRDNLMKGAISQEKAQRALDNLTKNQIGSDGYLTSTPLDEETARLVNEKVAQHLEFWGTYKSNIVAFVPDEEKEAYQAMHNQFNTLSASVTPRSSRDV